MKRYIISITTALLPLFTMLASSSTEHSDTLIHISKMSNVIISESESGITVKVDNCDNNGETTILIADYNKNSTVSTNQHQSRFHELTFNSCAIGLKSNHHWDCVTGGFNIGLVNAVGQPADMGLQWSKSFEIGWVNAIALRYNYKKFSISLGLGFDWRNYKMTGSSHYMVKDISNGIALKPYEENNKPGFSRIKVFSLGFPLLCSQKIPGTTISVTAGAILNLNTHVSLLSKYLNKEGNEVEEYADIKHRRVSYDLYGAIKLYKNIGLYIRYSPQSVLKSTSPFQFKPMSVGLTFLL
ncbi:MAG: hypothetical protein NC082_06625 [Clostridiales bacterium]|nr:hypothetical protein [Clostridiales bacterium]